MLLYRLRLHSGWAKHSVVYEADLTTSGDGMLPTAV